MPGSGGIAKFLPNMSRTPANVGMSRTPTKVRVKRERHSLGDFLRYPEEKPVKDAGVLDFSFRALRPTVQSAKSNVSPTKDGKRTTVKDLFRSRSKSFGGHENVSSNATDNTNSSAFNNEVGKELSEFLLQLWTNQQLCDIVIRVNGKDFLAHKLALAAHSEKFTSRYCERQRLPQTLSEINLLNSSVEATEEILRFIYTKSLNITDKNVEALLVCSTQLGITAAIELCRRHLMNFNSKNVLFYMQIAEKHGFEDILNRIESTVFDNFTEISKLESFLNSTFELVLKILNKDTIKARNELELFHAIVAWIDYNKQDRLQYAPQLLECVRFVSIPAKDIAQHIEPHTAIFQIPQCRDMLYYAFRAQALQCRWAGTRGCQRSFSQQIPQVIPLPDALRENQSYSLRTVGSPPGHSDFNVSIHTQAASGSDVTHQHKQQASTSHLDPQKVNSRSPSATKSVSTPKPSQNTFQVNQVSTPKSSQNTFQINQISTPKSSQNTLQVNQQSKQRLSSGLYPGLSTGLLPGAGTSATNYSGRYSPQPLPLPPKPDSLMVAGGINPFNPESAHSSKLVEQYNPNTNHWQLISTLPEPRHHLGAATLDGFLFIVGGSILSADDPTNLANPTDSCFRYSPSRNYWTRISSLKKARMYHGLTSLEGVLYAVGGHDEQGRPLNTVEYYNPDTDEWGMTESMTEAKIGVAVTGFHGLVYVMGGFYETVDDKFVLDTVECYDPRTNRWILKQSLPIPCCHANVVTVRNTLYLIGGSNMAEMSSAVTSLSSIYRYYEDEDMWEKVADMTTPRHDAGAAVIGTQIYIVGGVSSQEGRVLADVECMDVDSLTWSECESLAHPALGVSCCTLQGDIEHQVPL